MPETVNASRSVLANVPAFNKIIAPTLDWPITASFARVNLCKEYAYLLDAPIKETDPQFDDYMAVMGTEFSAEVYPSVEARNAALGAVNQYIEFVAVSRDEVEAIEYPKHRMAIGPALHEPGFEEVAGPVVKAAIDFERDLDELDCLRLEVTIARYTYYMTYQHGKLHLPEVTWSSPYISIDPSADYTSQLETVNGLDHLICRHWPVGYLQ